MPENSQPPPIIREPTLERIARFLGDHGSGPQIVGWLRGWGVAEELIEYPNTKWRMVYDILHHYACSADKKDHEMLYKVIAEMLHPLMFNGDKAVSEAAAADFNKFLEYDGIVAAYSGDVKKYFVYKEADVGIAEDEMLNLLNEEDFQQEQNELESYREPENKEKISTLRKAYQILMNLTEVFCGNTSKPTHELNDAYLKTKSLIIRVVNDLHLTGGKVNGVQRITKLAHYCIPFNNLFTAESEYKNYASHALERLHWDDIRPKMHATYGDIDELYRKVDGSDILSAPNVQQTLNELSLLLSKTKEENAKQQALKQKAKTPASVVHKIEIVNELKVRNSDESTVVKSGKRLQLPKFNPTDWAKASVQFLDERSVILTGDKKQVPADFASLGFANEKNGKPNTAWVFLLAMAKNNGETPPLELPIPDVVKQHKMRLSNFFKKLFRNDSEPFFEDSTVTHTYKLKIALIAPQTNEPKQDTLGVDEYLKDTMTEEYEDER